MESKRFMKAFTILITLFLVACGSEKSPALLPENTVHFEQASLDVCRALETQQTTRKTIRMDVAGGTGYYEFSPTGPVLFYFADGTVTQQQQDAVYTIGLNSGEYCDVDVQNGVVRTVTY
jgi:predicted small lipoprotein YifL